MKIYFILTIITVYILNNILARQQQVGPDDFDSNGNLIRSSTTTYSSNSISNQVDNNAVQNQLLAEESIEELSTPSVQSYNEIIPSNMEGRNPEENVMDSTVTEYHHINENNLSEAVEDTERLGNPSIEDDDSEDEDESTFSWENRKLRRR